jgi:hypothetical protein
MDGRTKKRKQCCNDFAKIKPFKKAQAKQSYGIF